MGAFLSLAILIAMVILIIAIIKGDIGDVIAGIIVALIASGGVILIIAYGAFSWGYVATQFYDWFVLKYYPNLPHFTLLQIIGFNFLISTVIRIKDNSDIKDDYRINKTTRSISVFASPWLTLLLGYLFYSWFL